MNIKDKIAALLKEQGLPDSPLCVARIMATISFVSYLGYAVAGLYKGDFDIHGFADGLMMVLAGSAALITGKQATDK
jgi:hypothetical protein